MIVDCEIRLALPGDAQQIAAMSRDFVEHGLGWRWNSGKVLRCIADRAANVVVACERGELVGFAIMQYLDDQAHLHLLAVQPRRQRCGIGAALLSWLEASALTAGIGVVYLEARSSNAPARAFYQRCGYSEFELVRRYYRGLEDGVRLAKDLWQR